MAEDRRQRTAISGRMSAVGCQRSAVSRQSSVVSRPVGGSTQSRRKLVKTICFKPACHLKHSSRDLLKRFSVFDGISPNPTSVLRPPAHRAAGTVVPRLYLFLNEKPRFPHAWLQVTCPSTRIGRITNYAAFSPRHGSKRKELPLLRDVLLRAGQAARDWTTRPSRTWRLRTAPSQDC